MPCMHWECSNLAIQRFYTGEFLIMLRGSLINVAWLKLFEGSLMEHCTRHATQATFKSLKLVQEITSWKEKWVMLVFIHRAIHRCKQTIRVTIDGNLIPWQHLCPLYMGFYVRSIRYSCILLVWQSSIHSINQYLCRMQEPIALLCPCTLGFYHVKVHEVVYWGFASILFQWSFLDSRIRIRPSKVLLPSIILLEHSLWTCKLVPVVIKPWFIMTVRLCHLINTCH